MDQATKSKLDANVADFYEANGQAFASSRRNAWNVMDLLGDNLKSGDLLVDVGAGNARLLLSLPKDIRYLGLEPSSSLREAAQKNLAGHPDAKIVSGGFPHLDLPDCHADAISCIAVLHHLPGAEARRQAIVELYRILKPGGTLLITVWNMRSRRFLSWQTFKSAWLGLTEIKGGDRGDIFYRWQGQKQARYVHAFTITEWRKLFDPSLWSIENLGAYDTIGWCGQTRGRNLAALVIKQ